MTVETLRNLHRLLDYLVNLLLNLFGFWNLRHIARFLIIGENIDATLVPLLLTPGLGDKRVHHFERFLFFMETSTEAHHARIIVLAGELSDVFIPDEGTADALNFVGSHLLTVAGAT